MFRSMLLVAVLTGCGSSTTPATNSPETPVPPAGELRHSQESHLSEIRQMTYGLRENAEAYWSFDGKELSVQSNRAPYECDQIYSMPVSADAAASATLVSSGKGRTTCAHYLPDNERIVYSSTHEAGEACPPVPDHSMGYVWPLYETYDIFVANKDGSNLQRLTSEPGYDAEATVCGTDGSILFTSTRDGDLELYRMDSDGSNVVRLTSTPGYDGGAFFSADCKQIVWRASRPTGAALEEYKALLAKNLVRPSKLEIFVANADGSNQRQITYLDAASFAPFFHPSGKRILFSTNHGAPGGRDFDIWAINTDGSQLERITYADGFDGFPMFSPDGSLLAFSSNRNNAEQGQTDVFIARWVDSAPESVELTAADRVLGDISWMADDARQGRGIGSPGLAATAAWLEQGFQTIGLTPVVDGGYRHPFEVVVSAERAAATALVIDGKQVADAAFVPSSSSATGAVTGKLVLAGYGITSKELGVDDYARVKAKGKVVVVRRFTPTMGKFEDVKVQRRYSDIDYKAWNAREHGAVGMIVVDLPAGAKLPEEAPMPKLRVDRHGDAGIPVVFLSREQGGALFKGGHRATITVDITKKREPAYNIVGKLEAGSADKLPGVIVIGAHYDHLGMGQEGSLAASHGSDVEPAVHNGADDNASGTAALLEVARLLATRRQELKRDVYFVAFSAEETGIVGSTALTRTPPEGLAADNIVAMFNMDMVGRMRNNTVVVHGGDSAQEWAQIAEPICAATRLNCTLGGDGYGPSDHTPFYAAGSPVLHFFTGAHEQYHRPDDDVQFINAAGAARVATLVGELAVTVGARTDKLTYNTLPAPAPAGDVRSYGASMGTIPDYTGAESGETGVLLAGVRKDGAADRAGIQRGDRIVKIGMTEVRTIRDMMFVLQQSKPGQVVPVTVVRAGKQVTVQLTFGKSRRR